MYEVVPERVVGFLVEMVGGVRAAGVGDLGVVKEALGRLHRWMVHGDVCRYNVLVGEGGGVMFIDFEMAILRCRVEEGEGWGEEMRGRLERTLREEMESLEGSLGDESTRGKPWGYEEEGATA